MRLISLINRHEGTNKEDRGIGPFTWKEGHGINEAIKYLQQFHKQLKVNKDATNFFLIKKYAFS
jgi:hypothetical protein